MKNPLPTKSLAVGLSLLSLATNGVFAYAAETNFWKERQLALGPRAPFLGPPAFERGTANDLRGTLSPFGTIRSTSNFDSRISNSRLAPTRPAGGNPFDRSANRPVLYHIQDVHMNADAQKNIGAAVRELIKNRRVDLVALEGAFGPLDIPSFRRYPVPENIRRVADYLLKENKISGPVHTALTVRLAEGQHLPPFIGIDDPDHYRANVDAYRRSSNFESRISKQLQTAKAGLRKKKEALFNRSLLDFDEGVQAYQDGTIELGDYVTKVAGYAKDRPISVETFLEALHMESSLSFPHVEDERIRLLNRLLSKLDSRRIAELTGLSAAFRMGQIQHAGFYERLKKLCETNGVDLRRFPHFNDYVQYVLLSDSIDVERLHRDLRRMEESIYRRLTRTETERALIRDSRRLYLTAKLVGFALTRDEWEEYERTKAGARNPGKIRGSNFDFGDSTSFRIPNVDLRSFERFYEEAEIRDRAMARNLRAAMEKYDAKNVVLVTGGFHAEGVKSNLESRISKFERGISIVNFVPRVSNVEGSSYLSVFAREKTPLDQIFEGKKLFLATQPIVSLSSFVRLLVLSFDRSRHVVRRFGRFVWHMVSRKKDGEIKKVWIVPRPTGRDLSLVSTRRTLTSMSPFLILAPVLLFALFLFHSPGDAGRLRDVLSSLLLMGLALLGAVLFSREWEGPEKSLGFLASGPHKDLSGKAAIIGGLDGISREETAKETLKKLIPVGSAEHNRLWANLSGLAAALLSPVLLDSLVGLGLVSAIFVYLIKTWEQKQNLREVFYPLLAGATGGIFNSPVFMTGKSQGKKRDRGGYGFAGGKLTGAEVDYREVLERQMSSVGGMSVEEREALINALVRIKRESLNDRREFFKTEEEMESVLAYQEFDVGSFIKSVQKEKDRYEKEKNEKGEGLFKEKDIESLLFRKLIPVKLIRGLMAKGLSKADATTMVIKWSDAQKEWEKREPVRDALMEGGLSKADATTMVITWSDAQKKYTGIKEVFFQLESLINQHGNELMVYLMDHKIETIFEDVLRETGKSEDEVEKLLAPMLEYSKRHPEEDMGSDPASAEALAGEIDLRHTNDSAQSAFTRWVWEKITGQPSGTYPKRETAFTVLFEPARMILPWIGVTLFGSWSNPVHVAIAALIHIAVNGAVFLWEHETKSRRQLLVIAALFFLPFLSMPFHWLHDYPLVQSKGGALKTGRRLGWPWFKGLFEWREFKIPVGLPSFAFPGGGSASPNAIYIPWFKKPDLSGWLMTSQNPNAGNSRDPRRGVILPTGLEGLDQIDTRLDLSEFNPPEEFINLTVGEARLIQLRLARRNNETRPLYSTVVPLEEDYFTSGELNEFIEMISDENPEGISTMINILDLSDLAEAAHEFSELLKESGESKSGIDRTSLWFGLREKYASAIVRLKRRILEHNNFILFYEIAPGETSRVFNGAIIQRIDVPAIKKRLKPIGWGFGLGEKKIQEIDDLGNVIHAPSGLPFVIIPYGGEATRDGVTFTMKNGLMIKNDTSASIVVAVANVGSEKRNREDLYGDSPPLPFLPVPVLAAGMYDPFGAFIAIVLFFYLYYRLQRPEVDVASSQKTRSFLKEFNKVVNRNPGAAENRAERSGLDGLRTVDGHDSAPAQVHLMAQNSVASGLTQENEAAFLESLNNPLSGNLRQVRHQAAMSLIRTRRLARALSSSFRDHKYSLMAFLIFFVAWLTVSPWDAHPGSSGAYAENPPLGSFSIMTLYLLVFGFIMIIKNTPRLRHIRPEFGGDSKTETTIPPQFRQGSLNTPSAFFPILPLPLPALVHGASLFAAFMHPDFLIALLIVAGGLLAIRLFNWTKKNPKLIKKKGGTLRTGTRFKDLFEWRKFKIPGGLPSYAFPGGGSASPNAIYIPWFKKPDLSGWLMTSQNPNAGNSRDPRRGVILPTGLDQTDGNETAADSAKRQGRHPERPVPPSSLDSHPGSPAASDDVLLTRIEREVREILALPEFRRTIDPNHVVIRLDLRKGEKVKDLVTVNLSAGRNKRKRELLIGKDNTGVFLNRVQEELLNRFGGEANLPYSLLVDSDGFRRRRRRYFQEQIKEAAERVKRGESYRILAYGEKEPRILHSLASYYYKGNNKPFFFSDPRPGSVDAATPGPNGEVYLYISPTPKMKPGEEAIQKAVEALRGILKNESGAISIKTEIERTRRGNHVVTFSVEGASSRLLPKKGEVERLLRMKFERGWIFPWRFHVVFKRKPAKKEAARPRRLDPEPLKFDRKDEPYLVGGLEKAAKDNADLEHSGKEFLVSLQVNAGNGAAQPEARQKIRGILESLWTLSGMDPNKFIILAPIFTTFVYEHLSFELDHIEVLLGEINRIRSSVRFESLESLVLQVLDGESGVMAESGENPFARPAELTQKFANRIFTEARQAGIDYFSDVDFETILIETFESLRRRSVSPVVWVPLIAVKMIDPITALVLVVLFAAAIVWRKRERSLLNVSFSSDLYPTFRSNEIESNIRARAATLDVGRTIVRFPQIHTNADLNREIRYLKRQDGRAKFLIVPEAFKGPAAVGDVRLIKDDQNGRQRIQALVRRGDVHNMIVSIDSKAVERLKQSTVAPYLEWVQDRNDAVTVKSYVTRGFHWFFVLTAVPIRRLLGGMEFDFRILRRSRTNA